MSNSAFALRKCFEAVVCAGVAILICGVFTNASAAQINPLLFSVSASSTRAVALESVSMTAEPFSLSSELNFSPNDPRTRVTIFCMNLDFLAGEGANALTADAEDAAHNHYPLHVEYVAPVPGFSGIYMVVLRLNDSMTSNLGDVLIRLNLHGIASNRVRMAIGQIGGGPADDPGAVGTPAPDTPPAAVTPLTLTQYQAQFSDPSLAAGADGLRFLEQTTWGPSDADLQHLRSIGMQAYINEQFNTPPQFIDNSGTIPPLSSDYPATPLYPSQPSAVPTPGCDATCVRDNYTLYPLQKQFFTNALAQPDQLRQRVSFAVHQFIVAAGLELNNNETSWYAPYLQTIDKDSFGNFRTLLYDITLNPGMGQFLNMRGNSQVAPNENYAREIMQLFSIGVDTLNPDGTPVLDAQGNRIPSYSQATITNLARVFTGWDLGPNRTTTINGVVTPVTNYLDPMVLNNNTARYDIQAKTLAPVSSTTFPACSNCIGGTAAQNLANSQAYKTNELNMAIDALFNHPNTGPYLCTQLIHQMVTSNPSPAYVGRCSAAFANNGSGTRGDMKAVITAILLDPEARGDVKTDPNYGHLREPVLLMTNVLRTFNGSGAVSDGVLASSPFSYSNDLGQNLFNPPTVFGYYPADNGLPGTSLFGPEFGILDTSTTFKRANFLNTLFLGNSGNGIPVSTPNRPLGTKADYSTYQALAGNPQQLVDTLNARMMQGTMSIAMNTSIVSTVSAIPVASAALRTQTAIYLVATSSQYQVQR